MSMSRKRTATLTVASQTLTPSRTLTAVRMRLPNETGSSARIHSDTQVELKYNSAGMSCLLLCLRSLLEGESLGSRSRVAPAH
jgi:hypothetical protein